MHCIPDATSMELNQFGEVPLVTREVQAMATNAPSGDGHRSGAVRKRTQIKTKVMGEEHFTKRSKKTGQFIDQKADAAKFKGVRKER